MSGGISAVGDAAVQGGGDAVRADCDFASQAGGWFVLVAAFVVVVASVWSGLDAVSARAAQACVNEAVRAEQGAAGLALPDCRAYELVSPPGSVPTHVSGQALAAAGGQRFAYYTFEPFPGSTEEGLFLLATRSADGWSVQNTTPPQGGLHNSDFIACFPSVFYSNELTSAVLSDGWNQVEEGFDQVCDGDDPPLVAGEPRGYANLFLRDNESGAYQLIDRPPATVTPADALFRAATPDLSHVVFEEDAKLTAQAPAGLALYEWSGDADYLVSVLPDGEPVAGTLVNGQQGSASFTHAMSANGETVFFYYGGDLYARLHSGHEAAIGGVCNVSDGAACTVQVDAAQAGAPGPGGAGTFVYASEDGARVFFTDEHRLTADATATVEAPDLYEYDVETETLSDLTVSASGSANVLGFSGGSADGSYVYFVATGVLTGAQENNFGAVAVRGRPNLYLRHAGTTTFIATLERNSYAELEDWQQGASNPSSEHNTGHLTSRVSPDGEYIVFNSAAQLTGEENEPVEASQCDGDRCLEIFIYNAAAGQLSCASCSPSGAQPTGPAEVTAEDGELLTPEPSRYLQRNVTDAGQVFFDTRSALVPQATNGEVNVYEYENGGVNLISSGTGSGGAEFLDASESGDDVFFATDQGLVQGDTDNQSSVYDARVDGGFAVGQTEAAQGQGCESAEVCRPPTSEPPAQLLAASAALDAGGNLLAPPVPVTPAHPKSKPVAHRALTRAQKLARALKACAKKSHAKRAACKAQARRRLGTSSRKRTGAGEPRRRASKNVQSTKGAMR